MSLAQNAIDTAEIVDGYRAACDISPLNAAAREGQSYTPSFLDKKTLEKLYLQMFRIPLLKSANIVILNSTAESGYPHTRPNALVCMPSSSVLNTTPDILKNTLCHEAIHIHQRENPEIWAQACRKDGWTPVKNVHPDFVERCRLNPDTFIPQRFWAWSEYHVPLPLFIREDLPQMNAVQIKWLDLRNNTLYNEAPSTFSKRYGVAPPQPEHPFELLAVEFAEKYLNTDELVRAKLASL